MHDSSHIHSHGKQFMDLRRRHISAESRSYGNGKLMRSILVNTVTSLFLCVLFTAPAHADVDLAYQPMRVELHLTPGQTQTGVIQLKNQGQQAVHLRARLLDFYVSEDNTPQFAVHKDDEYSCRTWAMLNPTE